MGIKKITEPNPILILSQSKDGRGTNNRDGQNGHLKNLDYPTKGVFRKIRPEFA